MTLKGFTFAGGGSGGGGAVSDATGAAKGILQLAGDLAGTAAAPTTPLKVSRFGGSTSTAAKLPFANVKDYGAVGDSTTDDSTAIQAAINAMDVNRGGTVFFPQGRYRIATGLTVTYPGTVLEGEGLPGVSRSQGQGSSRIISDNGVTAITFNGTDSTHYTLGIGLRNLHILAASGATTGSGVLVRDTEACLVENVTVSDYIGGVGLTIDGGTGNSQYWDLFNFSAGDCLTGLKLMGLAPNGCRLVGGYFAGQGATPRVGSVGVAITTGDTFRAYGLVVQGYETGVYVSASAVGHELFGPRLEFNNINLRLGASVRNFACYGGCFDNSILVNTGAGNVGIQIDTGATDCLIMPTTIAGTVTSISDNGTRTLIIDTNTHRPTSSSITTSSNYLGSSVTMTTAGTFYDGPTLTLAAGTYLLIGSVQLAAGTSALREWDAKLWDGTTLISGAAFEVTGTAAAGREQIQFSAVVTPAGSTTYKISATSSVGGDQIAVTASNSITKTSYLHAIKIG